jgi:hypothetical protein
MSRKNTSAPAQFSKPNRQHVVALRAALMAVPVEWQQAHPDQTITVADVIAALYECFLTVAETILTHYPEYADLHKAQFRELLKGLERRIENTQVEAPSAQKTTH